MKITEIANPMPHLFLDMDGVQADFFGAWADLNGVPHYKDITDPEAAIVELGQSGYKKVYDFFRTLPPLHGGQQIIQWLHRNKIPFTVLSAPLRIEGPASVQGKKDWLDEHNPGASAHAIFTSKKFKYAMSGSTPNVLVDDFGDQPFAYPGFPQQRHRGIRRAHLDGLTQGLHHAGALGNDTF